MTSAETTEVVERSAWPVFITVNRKEVKVDGPKVSGLDIKKAAIEQGLEIEVGLQAGRGDGGRQGKDHRRCGHRRGDREVGVLGHSR